MPVPDYQTLMRPLLTEVAKKGGETSLAAVFDEIADEFNLLPEDRAALTPAGGQSLLANRLHWAKTYMQKAGLIESTRHGYFKITSAGQSLLNDNSAKIDHRVLARFPEFAEWKSWNRTAGESAP